MIGRSGSKMGSLLALLVKLISAEGAGILHDFPRQAQQSIALREGLRSGLTVSTPGQVALEPRKSESAGAGAGIINV